MVSLPILHFNDVYRVRPFKLCPTSEETIDVTQFAAMLDDAREQWPTRPDGSKEGLVLFSGDVFAPSIESTVTRGSHMVPVLNEIQVDVSLTGNHDFDFGYPHLCKLIEDTRFPWVLSNIVDKKTSRVPSCLHEFHVLERAGIRIGLIGLVEQEWIGTVSSWPLNFQYKDMAEVGMNLSKRLRDPNGEHKCDIIIALTHSRVPNDIALAKAVSAHSPSVQASHQTASKHGIDIILGGHDHMYYISKGVTSWKDYDLDTEVLGAEEDHGDVLIIKSGTDFRDLSEFVLELEDTPEGSVRRKVIKSVRGIHHMTRPNSKSCQRVAKVLEKLLSSVSKALKAPVCKTAVELDCRSSVIRTSEAAAPNWFADVLRHAYDDALILKGEGGADGVLICAGTIRGDSVYGPGVITLGDILEILPFEDPIVVLELSGETIWAAIEVALSTWPAQEGRFPVVSGFRVSWDSRRPPGARVLGIWLLQEPSASATSTPEHSGATTPAAASALNLANANNPHEGLIDIEEVKNEKGGRKYKVLTRDYMAEGHDGFLPLVGQKYLVDEENGQMMSVIVRKYLLGCRFVNRMARIASRKSIEGLLDASTKNIIEHEQARKDRFENAALKEVASKWRRAAQLALRWSRAHYQDNIKVTEKEHMSDVDCFDGQNCRIGQNGREKEDVWEDLICIHPIVDGRLKDEGRE